MFISDREVKFLTKRLTPTVTIRIQFPVFVDKGVAAVQPKLCLFTSLILSNGKGNGKNKAIAAISNI